MLNEVSSFLVQAQQYETVTQYAISEDDRETLDTIKTNKKIRECAVEMAASIRKTTTSASSFIESLSPHPTTIPERQQLFHEWSENRNELEHLKERQEYLSAVEMQRRALEIQMLLAEHDGRPHAWVHSDEHDAMMEDLAALLLQCGTEEARQQALSILESQLGSLDLEPLDTTSTLSPDQVQKRNRLHLKLGQVYKDTGQLDRALYHSREAFRAYKSENPRNLQRIQEVGQLLSQIYEFQVQEGDPTQKAVRQTQCRGFKKELQSALGQPLPELECKAAVAWCTSMGISVKKLEEEYRFDIEDPDWNMSPLHMAAEKCQEIEILQQIIENSVSLEEKNSDQETPLLVAVEKSNFAAIKLLLKRGVNLQAKDQEGQTVLHKSQEPPVTKLLLRHRQRRGSATTDISTNAGIFRSNSTSTAATTFSSSSLEGDLEIDAQDSYQQTALWAACAGGRANTVKLLLAAKASPHISRYNKSPLAAVIESKASSYLGDPKRKVKVVEALIRAGADPQPAKELLRKPRGHNEKQILRALETQCGPTEGSFPAPSSVEGTG